jgi:hypothetical protein
MSLANLKVFNQYAYTTMQEMLSYNIGLFNAGTRGGLILRSSSNQGDFSDVAAYKRIAGLVRRRDAYGSGDVSATDLEMLLATSVKVAAGTPPVNIDPHWWQWIQRSPEEAGVVLGKQLAEDTMADMVAVAVKAFVAAVTNVGAAVVHDATAGLLGLGALNSGSALFGDRARDIQCWVIHSKPMHDLYGAALTNTAQLFTFGTVQIRTDAMGRPFVITDQPDLAYTSSGTKYHTLGLASGAVMIEQNPDYVENMETKNGKENITRTWQAQWSFNVGLKGFAWDKTNGGASPTNAALATGTNWDKYAASNKDISGILVNSQ